MGSQAASARHPTLTHEETPRDREGKLITQLRVLALLTQTESQTAQLRAAQSGTDTVARQLTRNAERADERTRSILEAIRHLGGVPDVVTPALGRLAGAIKAPVEHLGPLDEALLADLLVEHQLHDRASYLKVLATSAGETRVVVLADRLIAAHDATIEWLTTVLAEEALGGPSSLRTTPMQRAAGGASKIANAPVRLVTERVNKTVESVAQTTEQTMERVTNVVERAARATGIIREALTVGRDASLEETETLARKQGEAKAAATVHETRRDLGALREDELPIRKYDGLTIPTAITAIEKLTRPVDLRAVVRYEETHKNRARVVAAGHRRVEALAEEALAASN